jgi:alpha-1,2-mannosyltransferase
MRWSPAQRGPFPHPGRLVAVRVATVCIVVVAAAFLVRQLPYPSRHHFFDLTVYRDAVDWWLDGNPLYSYAKPHSRYGFTYPPFAALLMTPLTAVSQPVAMVLVTVASGAVVVVGTWWLVAPVARRAGWTPWFAVGLSIPVVYLLEPVRETIGEGNVNLFIAALVFADVIALRGGRGWAGVGIGLAAAVKLTPAVFVLYLLLTRRWRPALTAVGTFLAATAAAFAVAPWTSVQYWAHEVWQTSRVGSLDSPNNQSVLGMLARLADPGRPSSVVWLLSAGGVLVLAMWRAVRAFAQGDELVGVTLTGLAGCLVSPISWSHHLVWVVPAVVVLLDVTAGSRFPGATPRFLRAQEPAAARVAGAIRWAALAVLVAALIWCYDPHAVTRPGGDLAGVLKHDTYVVALLVLVVVLPIRAREPGQVRGGTWRRAKESAASTWRIVSSTTSDPCPASKR